MVVLSRYREQYVKTERSPYIYKVYAIGVIIRDTLRDSNTIIRMSTLYLEKRSNALFS